MSTRAVPNPFTISKIFLSDSIYNSKGNSTSAQYVTLQIKLDEEKSKHASLAWQNGFCPAFLHSLLRLV
jgi:hypothetical protein